LVIAASIKTNRRQPGAGALRESGGDLGGGSPPRTDTQTLPGLTMDVQYTADLAGMASVCDLCSKQLLGPDAWFLGPGRVNKSPGAWMLGPQRWDSTSTQRGPEVVFWPSVFVGGLGRQGNKNHTSSGTDLFFGLAAEGGKANKPLVSRTCVVCWPWYPRPPKSHLAKQTTSGPI
jgi:hypothetical protein